MTYAISRVGGVMVIRVESSIIDALKPSGGNGSTDGDVLQFALSFLETMRHTDLGVHVSGACVRVCVRERERERELARQHARQHARQP